MTNTNNIHTNRLIVIRIDLNYRCDGKGYTPRAEGAGQAAGWAR